MKHIDCFNILDCSPKFIFSILQDLEHQAEELGILDHTQSCSVVAVKRHSMILMTGVIISCNIYV